MTGDWWVGGVIEGGVLVVVDGLRGEFAWSEAVEGRNQGREFAYCRMW